MNEKSIELLEHFVPKNYIQQGHHGELSHENEIRILLEKVGRVVARTTLLVDLLSSSCHSHK